MGFETDRCSRCGEEGTHSVSMGLTFEHDAQLCQGCIVKWSELGMTDQRFVRFRQLHKELSALEFKTSVMERKDSSAEKIYKIILENYAEQDKIGKDIYFFAKLWADNEA